MKIRYLFSSPAGDIQADEETLKRPFRLSPSKEHPCLTLRDYFQLIECFLLNGASPPGLSHLEKALCHRVKRTEIREIFIRSEKHGGFYHIASAEVVLLRGRRKFAVVSALSDKGKACLRKEFETLQALNKVPVPPFLPEVYIKGEGALQGEFGTETMIMVLQEWFEGYHEWHLAPKGPGVQEIVVWDLDTGYRTVSGGKSARIFRQIAKVLTLYYNPRTYQRIHAWHHGSGDFIVRVDGPDVDVRLTTIRGYEPVVDFKNEGEANPWTALIFFFLDLSIRMRIDRLDGFRDLIWAEDFVVDATVEGFFEGLKIMGIQDRFPLGKPEKILTLMRVFSEEEWLRLADILLDDYSKDSHQEVPVILAHLERHVSRLTQSIQALE